MRVLVLLFTTVAILLAAPAFEHLNIYKQPDGSTFSATPKGDEYLHYLKTPNGAFVVYNKKTGYYEYAKVQEGALVGSGHIYKEQKLYNAIGLVGGSVAKPSLEELQQVREKNYKRLHR